MTPGRVASPADAVAGDDGVSVVHVVAKTHCDLGFTDLAGVIARRYVHQFFPRALEVAAELRERGGPERLVWTTGSLVLHWALTEGSVEQRNAVVHGVRRGDLAWHALPATTHTELMDVELVRSGLALSAGMDRGFRAGSGPTTAAKMTDVPGHTRGLVPLLAEAGVTFLHLGVNPAWPVPDVPPVFRWRAPDGSEVVVAYQAGGYGGTVQIDGLDEVLTFLHADDNIGPPSADEVVANHAALRERFPGAEIRASTLDAFARAVAASGRTADLPVVSAEIGDPWLFGAGSDPMKVAAYRAMLRARTLVRSRFEADGEALGHDLVDVDHKLLLVAEHTWGLDQKTWLPDTTRWDRAGLAELRGTPEGARFESSWTEQRDYVERAARVMAAYLPWAADGATPGGVDDLVDQIVDWPMGSDGVPRGGESGFVAVEPGREIDGGGWRITIDPVDGSVVGLVESASGRVLADRGHRLGLLRYQSFDAADYERFHAGLTPTPEDEWWARWDNTKPGIDAVADARSGSWAPERCDAWHATHQGGAWHDLLVRVAFAPELADRLGAPETVWTRWSWSAEADPDGVAPPIEATLWWVDKPANRLPEALWWSCNPVVAEPDRWTMEKLGQQVSPLDVVRGGGRSLHGIGDGGLRYDGPDGHLALHSVDAPLVAPGRPNLLDVDPPLPDMAGGWHVLLADNCWGTNFPMWIEGPARYRFTLST